jgi:2-polyprenyl-3-methyl-5-hydroxy-6-metoxy-1,4-benzoquinol methylase
LSDCQASIDPARHRAALKIVDEVRGDAMSSTEFLMAVDHADPPSSVAPVVACFPITAGEMLSRQALLRAPNAADMSVEDRYIIRGGLAGRERLRVLARAMYPTTAALFDRIGIAPGMSCLDVGCGGGDVTCELARRAAPTGRAVGIDMDATKLAIAREEADGDAGLAVEYREGDALTTEMAPEYDVVYVRFLLTHLADPEAAAARIAAALRRGGVLIVEDIDFTGCFCHPASTAYDRYVELYTQAAWGRGVDPNIGPRLPGLLGAAGCERVGLHVVQPAGMTPEGHEGDVKLVTPLTLENIADSAMAADLTTREEIDGLVAELYRLAYDTTTVLAFPRIVQTWGYRAAT